MDKRPKICITGITGFAGSWICKLALEDDQYSVRGTVRDMSNADKIEPIKEAFGEFWDKLELVEANLLDRDSLQAAVEGCTYVIHVASPVPLKSPDDENEVIKPAVEGTKDIFRACQKANVKRLIITSSCTVIEDFTKEECDESTTVDLDQPWVNAYIKSKILADRCVWEMVNEEGNQLEVVSLQPGLITGKIY